MIKGRIAETLIQELFLSLGYNVFNNNLKLAMESIFYLKMAPLESLFSKMVDMKNKNAKQLLGTILADAARRGKEEICQALINKTAPSLHYEVLNWTDSRV